MEKDLKAGGDILLEIGDLAKPFKAALAKQKDKLGRLVLYLDSHYTAVEQMSTAQEVKLHVYSPISERAL